MVLGFDSVGHPPDCRLLRAGVVRDRRHVCHLYPSRKGYLHEAEAIAEFQQQCRCRVQRRQSVRDPRVKSDPCYQRELSHGRPGRSLDPGRLGGQPWFQESIGWRPYCLQLILRDG